MTAHITPELRERAERLVAALEHDVIHENPALRKAAKIVRDLLAALEQDDMTDTELRDRLASHIYGAYRSGLLGTMAPWVAPGWDYATDEVRSYTNGVANRILADVLAALEQQQSDKPSWFTEIENIAVHVCWQCRSVTYRHDWFSPCSVCGESGYVLPVMFRERAAPPAAAPAFAESLVRTFTPRCLVCQNKHDPHCAGCGCARTGGCSCPAAAPAEPRTFDMLAHLCGQRQWSERTFGPGARTAGVLDHIRKELREIEQDPTDLAEWIDVVILALDGAWRAGHTPHEIIAALQEKQERNEAREWPDWRTSDPDKAIEHVRITQPAVPPYQRDGAHVTTGAVRPLAEDCTPSHAIPAEPPPDHAEFAAATEAATVSQPEPDALCAALESDGPPSGAEMALSECYEVIAERAPEWSGSSVATVLRAFLPGEPVAPAGGQPVWYADNELWNAAVRQTDGLDIWPFLCPTCLTIVAADLGVAPWRQYVFVPQPNTEYSAGCLADIARFLESVRNERQGGNG